MEYFYAYLPEKQQYDEVLSSLQISKKQIFIDQSNDYKNWKHLMKDVKHDDTVYIPSIEMFANEEADLRQKLETVNSMNVQLFSLDQRSIDAKLLLDFMNFLNQSRKRKAKELQRVGIERALEKKHKGEGNFGRPRIHRPDDFEEQLDRIFNKEMTHEDYREELGMKRSTYYKLVHEYKLKLEKEEGKA